MVSLLVRHTVDDFDEWKRHFENHAETREEYGERGYRLFHGAENPAEVTVLFDWDSATNARAFLEESDLREVMAAAGVQGDPDVSFLEEVEASMRRA